MKQRIACTFTGGIESTVLAYKLGAELEGQKIFLLSCNYGQATWQKTRELAKLHVAKLHARYSTNEFIFVPIKVALPSWSKQGGLFEKGFKPPKADHSIDYSKQEKTYEYALVDGRNAFLFLNMLSYCSLFQIPVLYTGHQYEKAEWDNYDSYRHRTEDFGPGFLDRMNLLQEVGFKNRVRIEAPFILTRSSKLDVMKQGMKYAIQFKTETYSCQFMPECGKCDNCICRANALTSYYK